MVGRIIFIVAIILNTFLSGCGNESTGGVRNAQTDVDPTHAPMARQVHIGILLYSDSRMPQARGFLEGLRELGYEESKNLAVTMLNANNDKKQLQPLAEKMSQLTVDMVVAAGGLEAEIMKPFTEKTGIPMVVLYINSIIERQFVKDRRAPGWNVTGVDNLNAELSGKRLELLSNLVPKARKVLVLYDPKIEPSFIGLKHAQDQAGKHGITIDARQAKNVDEIAAVLNAIKPGDVDAMLLVPTAHIDGALADIVLPASLRLKIPVMAHSRPMVETGATASYGAPFYEIGKQAARLAEKIINGVPAEKIPFEIPSRYDFTVNEGALIRLNMAMSELVRSQVTDYVK